MSLAWKYKWNFSLTLYVSPLTNSRQEYAIRKQCSDYQLLWVLFWDLVLCLALYIFLTPISGFWTSFDMLKEYVSQHMSFRSLSSLPLKTDKQLSNKIFQVLKVPWNIVIIHVSCQKRRENWSHLKCVGRGKLR